MRDSRASSPLRRLAIDFSDDIGISVQESVELLDGLDARGVQIEQLLEGGVLRTPLSGFEVADTSIRDPAQVVDFLLGESRPLPQLAQTCAGVGFHSANLPPTLTLLQENKSTV